MLPTLRRRCHDVNLILDGFVVFTTGNVMLCLALLFFFSVLFRNVIISLGEVRAGPYVCFSCNFYLFILHAFTSVLFSLPLHVRGWLRLVIVALSRHFYQHFGYVPSFDMYINIEPF